MESVEEDDDVETLDVAEVGGTAEVGGVADVDGAVGAGVVGAAVVGAALVGAAVVGVVVSIAFAVVGAVVPLVVAVFAELLLHAANNAMAAMPAMILETPLRTSIVSPSFVPGASAAVQRSAVEKVHPGLACVR
jgi:hypothetical protein